MLLLILNYPTLVYINLSRIKAYRLLKSALLVFIDTNSIIRVKNSYQEATR